MTVFDKEKLREAVETSRLKRTEARDQKTTEDLKKWEAENAEWQKRAPEIASAMRSMANKIAKGGRLTHAERLRLYNWSSGYGHARDSAIPIEPRPVKPGDKDKLAPYSEDEMAVLQAIDLVGSEGTKLTISDHELGSFVSTDELRRLLRWARTEIPK